ncbi:hypothetical protein NDY24_20265 [Xanthomonas hortorum pv. pelargonii]|nr:hypothetical protein NDY24_20265 [Xanthomonas hortorum pv. pelargonii]
MATANIRTPQREKNRSVFFMQVSRDSDSRHSDRKVRLPKRRPARYQARSPSRLANTETPNAANPASHASLPPRSA